jgi:hypothetical protein
MARVFDKRCIGGLRMRPEVAMGRALVKWAKAKQADLVKKRRFLRAEFKAGHITREGMQLSIHVSRVETHLWDRFRWGVARELQKTRRK